MTENGYEPETKLLDNLKPIKIKGKSANQDLLSKIIELLKVLSKKLS